MRTRVKICGLTTEQGVDAAVACGADAIGFVFAPSPRRVTPESAAALGQRLPSFVVKVAVFARPTRRELNEVLERFLPDRIQMEAESILDLGNGIGAKAIPVFNNGPDLLERIEAFRNNSGDHSAVGGPERESPGGFGTAGRPEDEEETDRPTLLLDGRASGHGDLADWSLAARISRTTRVVLAGGLNPDNVAQAIRIVRPYGVDVSSGVESAPGVKDPARISAFVAAVRGTEEGR